MALSDHEQQLLAQLEKQLRSEDPRFAQNISASQSNPTGSGFSPKRLVAGIIVLMTGIAITLASIFFLDLPLAAFGGVLGFAVMVFGAYWAVSGKDGNATQPNAGGSAGTNPTAKRTKSSFMDRVEQRWEQRKENGQ